MINNLKDQLNSRTNENHKLKNMLDQPSKPDLKSLTKISELEQKLTKKEQEMITWRMKFEHLKKNNQNPVLFEDSDKFDLLQSNSYFTENKTAPAKAPKQKGYFFL
jgi:predicted nuclease with TOPRIM domain